MANLLTDRAFWVNYWESKKGLAVQLPSNYLFHQQLADVIQKNNVKTAIELGGFPGYYAVFLKKYFKLDVTLLDYFVHPPVVNELLAKNGLTEKDIHIIETDLFNYTPEKQYDLVLSCGLIEHFNDTADIINRHIAFVKRGGTLFITLPNFKAVNGWFQKNFDRENYDKHNIDSMDPALLKSICEQAGLTEVKSGYFGRFSVWLENESQKSAGVRLFKKAVWLTGKIFTKIIPFESKNLSPYIILVAKKK
jgi:SAM-dependent methyltransferase